MQSNGIVSSLDLPKMNQPQFIKGKFDVSNITWTDVFEKLEHDREEKTFTVITPKLKEEDILYETEKNIVHEGLMNTIVCEGVYTPKNMLPLFKYMNTQYGMVEFHQYISFNIQSSTFGNHDDTDDVIIVPIIGRIGYNVNGLGKVEMNPGDMLYIPKYVHHEPILYGSRATLSFS